MIGMEAMYLSGASSNDEAIKVIYVLYLLHTDVRGAGGYLYNLATFKKNTARDSLYFPTSILLVVYSNVSQVVLFQSWLQLCYFGLWYETLDCANQNPHQNFSLC